MPEGYEPPEAIKEDLRERFTYHPPRQDQVVRYTTLRENAHRMAQMIVRLTPPSREQSLALTKLDELVMFANAAIARNEDPKAEVPNAR